MFYDIGIIGDNIEYVSDHEKTQRQIDRVVDLINYQYSNKLILHVYPDVGVGLWALDSCEKHGVRYHLHMPCMPDKFSEHWYAEQKQKLNNKYQKAYGNTLSFTSDENIMAQYLVGNSRFLVVFWNGMKQGTTYNVIKHAIETNILVLNSDLQLITARDL